MSDASQGLYRGSYEYELPVASARTLARGSESGERRPVAVFFFFF